MQLKSHSVSAMDTKTLDESIQFVHTGLDDLFSGVERYPPKANIDWDILPIYDEYTEDGWLIPRGTKPPTLDLPCEKNSSFLIGNKVREEISGELVENDNPLREGLNCEELGINFLDYIEENKMNFHEHGLDLKPLTYFVDPFLETIGEEHDIKCSISFLCSALQGFAYPRKYSIFALKFSTLQWSFKTFQGRSKTKVGRIVSGFKIRERIFSNKGQ